MYQKYTTHAVVLRIYERREADALVVLATKDFGVVYALAVGARKESSRMRYAFVTSAYISISLVKGKAGWRAVGAVPLSPALSAPAIVGFARVTRLVLRLVHGEHVDVDLYETIVAAREAFGSVSVERRALVELLIVARVLYTLGYLPQDSLTEALLSGAITDTELTTTEREQTRLLGAVNTALSASQL